MRDGALPSGGNQIRPPAVVWCTRAVRFDRYGDVDVLDVVDVDKPEPGPGQVFVAVKAAGINPR